MCEGRTVNLGVRSLTDIQSRLTKIRLMMENADRLRTASLRGQQRMLEYLKTENVITETKYARR